MCNEINPHDLGAYGNAMLLGRPPEPPKSPPPAPRRKRKYIVYVKWSGTTAQCEVPIFAESSEEAADLAAEQLMCCLTIDGVELATEEL